MPEQQSLFNAGTVNMRQFAPANAAIEGAKAYTKGRYDAETPANAMARGVRGYKVQRAYKQAQASPEAPGIRKSYESLRKGVNSQYEFMTKPTEHGGMGLKHETTDHDPYSTPQQMADDVNRGTIKTMSTKVTGGHAVFSNDENDRFRAVHDVFGHAATGRDFSRHGEEGAFLSHKQMFPKTAYRALASETRGQNSYLNYGGGQFPEQESKPIGLPAFASRNK
jgi:hypothetical protein